MASTHPDDPAGWQPWNDEDDRTNYRSMWTRSTDPVFGDSANAVALRKHLKGSDHLQPHRHSADRYFPSSALSIPFVRRYEPSIATTDWFMSNSRGPICFDVTGKSYKCHLSNRLPAFMYT